MRCLSCNAIMSPDAEARIFVKSGTKVDLCNGCTLDIPPDLINDFVEEETTDDLYDKFVEYREDTADDAELQTEGD